jgi:quinolinate synthase
MKQDADNSELITKILDFKKRRNAVILSHNYQRPEVQDIGDFVGDSLELSRKAAETTADTIVFCGVHFMAETASILSPEKIVLLPDAQAGCPMADMITAEELIARKQEMPGVHVVCYVNSSAAVKAESEVCCTSANAENVVGKMGDGEILFIPDQYLGQYVSSRTGRSMVMWPGYCPTHARIQAEDILALKTKYPGAVALAHPECRPDVTAAADEVLSTSGMLRFAHSSSAKELIVATETGILHRMRKENPGKVFIPAMSKAICSNMKKITLEKILWALEEMKPEIRVTEDIRVRARSAVDRMLAA